MIGTVFAHTDFLAGIWHETVDMNGVDPAAVRFWWADGKTQFR